SAIAPQASGPMLEPSDWIANSTPIAEPPILAGGESRGQACSPARSRKKKKTKKGKKKTKAHDPPPTIKNAKITAATRPQLMMIWRRPILSDRWPEIGDAMKPAVCSAAMAAPIMNVE